MFIFFFKVYIISGKILLIYVPFYQSYMQLGVQIIAKFLFQKTPFCLRTTNMSVIIDEINILRTNDNNFSYMVCLK